MLGFTTINGGQDDGSDLQNCNDDDEEAVSSQQDSRFLDGTAITQETDDEDKCTGGDENVSTLLDYSWLCQLLCEKVFMHNCHQKIGKDLCHLP